MSRAAAVNGGSMSAGTESASRGIRGLWGRTDRLTRAIFVIALIGTAETIYLTFVHYYGLGALICAGAHSGVSSCEQVQSSVYSKLAGVPVALLGLLGYLSILASLRIKGELGRAAGFCIALIGFGFSAYLTYREVFTLKEICEWCVASAIMMTILAVLTSIRFLRGEQPSA
ncbi:MAG: vitamin K epoxide reductase family protein [Conexibacteraceae bacterium]|nr:vitamin K epoxide reductase family protein [Conexibacteraceae bacterium]